MEPRSGVKVAVGIFVCLGLVLFGGSIFLLGQRGRYFATQHPLRTAFTSVVGLHEGAAVRLAGVAVGRVTGIQLGRPGQKVLVDFNVAGDAIENIRQDSRARLETMGFMGDKFVEVSVGSPAEPQVGDGATLAAEDPIDVAALVGQGQRLLGNAEGLTAALARGDGALPWLINDPESKRLIAETLGSVRAVTASLEHGEGAAGWLLRDPASRQLLQHAARTVEAFEALAADVRRGPGLAHALIYDPEGSRLLPKVSQTLQETHALLDAIRHSNGAIPTLLFDPDSKRLVEHLQKLSQNLEEITGKLARGEGTLGAMLADPTIYDDLAALLEGAERSRLVRWGIRHTIDSGRQGRKERGKDAEK
jgi:phospholipid/cholesterol/gamma-HCH transport system substrate-binding protein